MNIETIQAKVNEIATKATNGDDEAAHALEDDLMREFIEYIAFIGFVELSEKARLILTTAKLDFQRWCS